ncbi:hypothetical protein SCALM49S_10180 [Streptomyces californicus]
MSCSLRAGPQKPPFRSVSCARSVPGLFARKRRSGAVRVRSVHSLMTNFRAAPAVQPQSLHFSAVGEPPAPRARPRPTKTGARRPVRPAAPGPATPGGRDAPVRRRAPCALRAAIWAADLRIHRSSRREQRSLVDAEQFLLQLGRRRPSPEPRKDLGRSARRHRLRELPRRRRMVHRWQRLGDARAGPRGALHRDGSPHHGRSAVANSALPCSANGRALALGGFPSGAGTTACCHIVELGRPRSARPPPAITQNLRVRQGPRQRPGRTCPTAMPWVSVLSLPPRLAGMTP